MQPDAEQLMKLARQGDPDALGLLWEHYRGYLRLLARLQIYRRLQGKADASDMVQETFLQANLGFDDFEGQSEGQLLQWLRKILASRLAGLVRRYYQTQQRDPRLERDVAEELDRSSQALDRALLAAESSPSQGAARREQAVRLAEALEQLPAEYREAIILHNLQGLTFSDVADQMQRSPEAVRKLWVRGLAKMRGLLGDDS
jgi:RNA polymerase sigma-70 factor (ECF subfamily)